MPTTALIAQSVRLKRITSILRGVSEIKVPAGDVEVDVMRGFENHFEEHKVRVNADSTAQLTVLMVPLFIAVDATSNWVSGDVHVHMNYAVRTGYSGASWWSRPLRRIWGSWKIWW